MKDNVKILANIGSIVLLIILYFVCQKDLQIIGETGNEAFHISIEITQLEEKEEADQDETTAHEEAEETELSVAREEETSVTEAHTETQEESEMQPVVMIGYLMDYDIEMIRLLMDSKEEIDLPLTGAEIDLRSGFSIGNVITVEYTGSGEQIKVIRVADSADSREHPASEEKIEQMSGILKEMKLGELTIVTEEKQEVVFKAIYTSVSVGRWKNRKSKVTVSYVESESGRNALFVQGE